MKDRSYYRTEEDRLLIEEAKYYPNSELAVVLGERLDDVLLEAESDIYEAKERAADFERDANRMDDEIYHLKAKLDVYERVIEAQRAELEQLKKGN